MLVQNMLSYNGNPVKNQFIVHLNNAAFFQSYEKVVAIVKNGVVTVSSAYNYSRTTTKYLRDFMNDCAWFYMDKETRKKYNPLMESKLPYGKVVEKAIKENIFKYKETL